MDVILRPFDKPDDLTCFAAAAYAGGRISGMRPRDLFSGPPGPNACWVVSPASSRISREQ